MIKKISLSIVSTMLAFSFAACGDTSENPSATVTVTEQATPAPSPESGNDGLISDEDFVSLVQSETDEFDNSPPSDIVAAAKAVCTFWESGATIEDVFNKVLDSGLDAYDGGFLVGAATENYCPEYSDRIKNSEGSGSNT